MTCRAPNSRGAGGLPSGSSLASLHLEQFKEQRGGLWLLGDEEQAQLVADSVYLLGFHPPVTEYDVSWLSFAALEQAVPTFHLFNEKLDGDDTGRRFLDRWRAWLEACQCQAQEPSGECEVHLVLRALPALHRRHRRGVEPHRGVVHRAAGEVRYHARAGGRDEPALAPADHRCGGGRARLRPSCATSRRTRP
jgi:hypothetical protein